MEWFDITTVLVPLLLLIALIGSKKLREASVRHGFMISAVFGFIGMMTRTLYTPQMILYPSAWSIGRLPASTLFVLDRPMCWPLKIFWETGTTQSTFPFSVMLAYYFVVYFLVYRVVCHIIEVRHRAEMVRQRTELGFANP